MRTGEILLHPAGKGYADFIFKPRFNASWRPAMVVELKYNRSVDTAIRQIKEKDIMEPYPDMVIRSFWLKFRLLFCMFASIMNV